MLVEIVIIALIVFAIHFTLQQGEIFGKFGDALYDNLPEKMHDPVFNCPVCMTPWHGTLIYWLIFGYGVEDWLITVVSAMGLVVVILKLAPEKDGWKRFMKHEPFTIPEENPQDLEGTVKAGPSISVGPVVDPNNGDFNYFKRVE